jgi:alpha-mannosidase
VFVVPNFHPASCGWLTDFSKERNYCANSYLDHLDRVADDPDYAFVLSEVNNMIAILNFQPQRFAELKRRMDEGRVEAVNAFFLEPTICLSGGEALVKQGVEGIRWQRAMLGRTPRHAWMIDATGMHEQMAQITAGLGLETLVHCRNNPSHSTVYWAGSPDGSRIPAVSSGHYNIWTSLFRAEAPLPDPELQKLIQQVRLRRHHPHASRIQEIQTPDDLPYLVLGGSGDYSMAPHYRGYPRKFLEQWSQAAPDLPLRFATFGDYIDAVTPLVHAGKVGLPTHAAGWDFSYKAFWIQNPKVKQHYRAGEHLLQATEMLATISSLRADGSYPSQDLYHAWLQMLLNMDRNTLWGAAGGMVFEHPTSWDAQDRFRWVDGHCRQFAEQAVRTLRRDGEALAVFNPANWPRTDPVVLSVAEGREPKGIPSQRISPGQILCQVEQPAMGFASLEMSQGPGIKPRVTELPRRIETDFYVAALDPNSGDLVSLKTKPSGREVLSGPANVLVAEVPLKRVGAGNHMLDRPQRQRLADSSQVAGRFEVTTGALATRVEVRSRFYGGRIARRVFTFYHHHPRIDFDTYLTDIPDPTVVVAEFPLADPVTEVRRGIPYGFSHGAWPEPTPERGGFMQGITPAVRWSAYTLSDTATVALLDRGLTGREIHASTPVLYLLNTTEKYNGYPNPWLSGKGPHHLQYALVAAETSWDRARIPHLAWEYNAAPVVVEHTASRPAVSLIETSDNVIVQAMRREGDHIELRLVEALGRAGEARIKVNLPHLSAALTNMLGEAPRPLAGGPEYRWAIRPQQIVTLRLRTTKTVPGIKPLTDWAPLVPPHKQPALEFYDPEVKGHPPHG